MPPRACASRLAAGASLRAQLESLVEVLALDDVPRRIECFDISHTSGRETVASCVVFGPDGPIKSDYRRFNIRDIEPGDDYGAIRSGCWAAVCPHPAGRVSTFLT